MPAAGSDSNALHITHGGPPLMEHVDREKVDKAEGNIIFVTETMTALRSLNDSELAREHRLAVMWRRQAALAAQLKAVAATCAAAAATRAAEEAEYKAVAELRAAMEDDALHGPPGMQEVLRLLRVFHEGGTAPAAVGAGVDARATFDSCACALSHLRDECRACMCTLTGLMNGHDVGRVDPLPLPACKVASVGDLLPLAKQRMATVVLELRAFEGTGPLLCELVSDAEPLLRSRTQVDWAAFSLELALVSNDTAVFDAAEEAVAPALAVIAQLLHDSAESVARGGASGAATSAHVGYCCRLIIAVAARPCGAFMDWQPVAESAICLSSALQAAGAGIVLGRKPSDLDHIDAACEDVLTALLLRRPSAVAGAVAAVIRASFITTRHIHSAARLSVCLSVLNCAQLVALAYREPHAPGFGASPVLPIDPEAVASEWFQATQQLIKLSSIVVPAVDAYAAFNWRMVLGGFAVASAPLGSPITTEGLAALGLPAEAPDGPAASDACEPAHSWDSLAARFADGFVAFGGRPRLVERLRRLEARVRGQSLTEELASLDPQTPSQKQAAMHHKLRSAHHKLRMTLWTGFLSSAVRHGEASREGASAPAGSDSATRGISRSATGTGGACAASAGTACFSAAQQAEMRAQRKRDKKRQAKKRAKQNARARQGAGRNRAEELSDDSEASSDEGSAVAAAAAPAPDADASARGATAAAFTEPAGLNTCEAPHCAEPCAAGAGGPAASDALEASVPGLSPGSNAPEDPAATAAAGADASNAPEAAAHYAGNSCEPAQTSVSPPALASTGKVADPGHPAAKCTCFRVWLCE